VRELQQAQDKLQVEADDLTQRCTQLHDDNLHMTSVLAQREHELLGGFCLGRSQNSECAGCCSAAGGCSIALLGVAVWAA
jgi:hypothetical protein